MNEIEAISIEKQAGYWDDAWAKRLVGGKVSMNQGKYHIIIEHLWRSPHIFQKEKLDVGCGPAQHSEIMSRFIKGWAESYSGIDLSQKAVGHAKGRGLNCHVSDFLRMELFMKYDVFMFWDVLEHFDDLELVAKRVNKCSEDDHPYILGNIPLYLSEVDRAKGGIENMRDIVDISKFCSMCGCTKLYHNVYGINGFPYMIFEGFDPDKKKKDLNNAIA